MGWRYRKSLNLGFGFRINLSKSGIGYSWGFPGYRVTKMANGRNRTTFSIPGTGLSYVEDGGGHSSNGRQLSLGETENYRNIPIAEIQKNDPILSKINKIVLLNRFSNLLLFLTFGIVFYPGFIMCGIVGLIIKIYISLSSKIGLYYEFDNDTRKMYDSLKEALIILSFNRRIWQINSSTKIYNSKYNAGSGHNIERNNAYITTKMPWFIKTNIDIYGLNLRNQKMFFTPDRVLVFRPFGKVFGCTYNDMRLGVDTTRFIENGRIYKDSEVVDYNWQYSNKNGGKDLRFGNNRQFPVCKYGELTIESPNGINTVLEFSNHELTDSIQNNLIIFGNQFNKILAKSKGTLKEEKKNEDKANESVLDEKRIITDVSELIGKSNHKTAEKSKVMELDIQKEYKLPDISLLDDEESKNIIPFVEKMLKEKKTYIPIGITKDDTVIEAISSLPNMLIGGTVMSGKTAYINTVISSILITKKPCDVKFLIYDSKKVDYAIYNGIPHLLCPIITDNQKLKFALNQICNEIQNRTKKLEQENVKNLSILNSKLETGKKIPDIIVVIDDFSTLNTSEEINDAIEFISSNGWNVNVYLIVSANHPSANVISTVSKSNFPSRLSFRVSSSRDSQIIVDQPGAEKLNGIGNALYLSRTNSNVVKIKVPYISDEISSKIVDACRKQLNPEYLFENNNDVKKTNSDFEDPMYDEVVEFAIQAGKVSASLLQRRFRFGYNRAALLIDLLEERGIIGPQNGSKPREVLVKISKDGE